MTQQTIRPLNVRIPLDLLHDLKRIALERQIADVEPSTMASIVEQILREHLPALELKKGKRS